MPYNFAMGASLDRAERSVEEQSVALKKPLGLGDLVLTQIVFVVGSSWVGTAAKLGTSHLFFWLLAILLFYIPQAAVVIYLSRLMPLEGGIYQWAKLAFNEFTGFIVAWNLWLLSIMVIAMGGMFITTNISYALGDAAAWMRDSPWCVSLVSCVLVSGLGWTGVRGLSLGKWVHNIGGFAMFLAYGALIFLPFISLARGDLDTYRPLQIAAPAISLFYCFNIFSKLAVGGLAGFEYVGILAGEAHAPARNIGRSVMIAAPIIALMFVLGTSSVLAFIGNNQIDLIGPVPQTLAAWPAFVPNCRRDRFGGDPADDSALHIFDEYSFHRQLPFTDGGRLGQPFAGMVFAPASALQNTDQLNHVRRRDHVGDRHLEPDRRGIAGSISNRGQRRQRFLRNCLYSDVCDPNRGRRRDTIRSALLAATRRRLRSHRMSAGHLLHHLSDH